MSRFRGFTVREPPSVELIITIVSCIGAIPRRFISLYDLLHKYAHSKSVLYKIGRENNFKLSHPYFPVNFNRTFYILRISFHRCNPNSFRMMSEYSTRLLTTFDAKTFLIKQFSVALMWDKIDFISFCLFITIRACRYSQLVQTSVKLDSKFDGFSALFLERDEESVKTQLPLINVLRSGFLQVSRQRSTRKLQLCSSATELNGKSKSLYRYFWSKRSSFLVAADCHTCNKCHS